MLAPVARALAGLHAPGRGARRRPPGNVLLERTGRPLLADLGVASLAGDVPGQLYGTEGFVAPEVLDRGVVTTASDVYAVGALAWWCVTGSAPAPVALRRPLEELAPGLPDAWSEVTRRALLGRPGRPPDRGRAGAGLLRLGSVRTAAAGRRERRDIAADPTAATTRGHEPLSTGRSSHDGCHRAARACPARRRPDCGAGEGPDVSLTTALVAPPRAAAGAACRRGRSSQRAAALGTVVVLTVGLAVGGLMAAGRLSTPDWVYPSRDAAGPRDASGERVVPVSAPGAAAAPATRGATREPVTSRSDPATDQAAPQRDPRGLMVALSTLRAEVMTSGSLPDLARLDAPGSEALAQDTALLKDLEASGQSWQGVALTVTVSPHRGAHRDVGDGRCGGADRGIPGG